MEKKIKLKLPMLPNFLFDENKNQYKVSELSDGEIRELGKEWTEALLKRNRERNKKNN